LDARTRGVDFDFFLGRIVSNDHFCDIDRI